MTNRRDALASAMTLFCGAVAAHAQNQKGPAGRGPVFKQDLPNVSLDGWEVTVSEIPMPPGQVGRAHRHPGFVLAYVLEGEILRAAFHPRAKRRAGIGAGLMHHQDRLAA